MLRQRLENKPGYRQPVAGGQLITHQYFYW